MLYCVTGAVMNPLRSRGVHSQSGGPLRVQHLSPGRAGREASIIGREPWFLHQCFPRLSTDILEKTHSVLTQLCYERHMKLEMCVC